MLLALTSQARKSAVMSARWYLPSGGHPGVRNIAQAGSLHGSQGTFVVTLWMAIMGSSRKMCKLAFWYLWVPNGVPRCQIVGAVRMLPMPLWPRGMTCPTGVHASHGFRSTTRDHSMSYLKHLMLSALLVAASGSALAQAAVYKLRHGDALAV